MSQTAPVTKRLGARVLSAEPAKVQALRPLIKVNFRIRSSSAGERPRLHRFSHSPWGHHPPEDRPAQDGAVIAVMHHVICHGIGKASLGGWQKNLTNERTIKRHSDSDSSRTPSAVPHGEGRNMRRQEGKYQRPNWADQQERPPSDGHGEQHDVPPFVFPGSDLYRARSQSPRQHTDLRDRIRMRRNQDGCWSARHLPPFHHAFHDRSASKLSALASACSPSGTCTGKADKTFRNRPNRSRSISRALPGWAPPMGLV